MVSVLALSILAGFFFGSGVTETTERVPAKCDASHVVDRRSLDGAIRSIRVQGMKVKVKRRKLAKGETPRVTFKANRPANDWPQLSLDDGVLKLQSLKCTSSDRGEEPTRMHESSGTPRLVDALGNYLLGLAPLVMHRSGVGMPFAMMLAAGMWTRVNAEASCDDTVDIEIAVPDDTDYSDSTTRADILRSLKDAVEDPSTGDADGFLVDPSNFRFYRNGGHRRPTDPASGEEIQAAQKLLFGTKGGVTSLEAADALAADKNGWAKAASALAHIGGVDPAAISGVSNVSPRQGDPSNAAAQASFLEHAKNHGFQAAHDWLRQPAQDPLRRNLRWWNVNQVASATAERKHVIAVENAIAAGKTDYDMQRIIFVRLTGGQTAFTENNTKLWGSELHIAVDVADLANPRIVPERIEVYSQMVRDYNMPSKVPLGALDQSYLMAAAMALYGNDHSGAARNMEVFYNGKPQNRDATYSVGARSFMRPFEWLDGTHARSLGHNYSEFLMVAQLNELSPSTIPFDGHQEMSGTFMFPVPLTMVYGITTNGALVEPDTHNTLPQSTAFAMCFFGRGLAFTASEAAAFAAALNATSPKHSDFAVIVSIVSHAIQRAWGSDEASPGSGFRPGVLARRADGEYVPGVVIKHSYNVPTYVNHATSKALEGKLFDPKAKHRDARDNLPHMAPPIDSDDTPIYKPNGKPRTVVQADGQSFTIDGYGVTYNVGITWKFLIGVDPDAGLTMYHIRIVLPPSQAHPNGEEVPYLYRAYSPNFGTDYSTSNLGNPYSYLFFESHYQDMASVHKPSTCSGATLPVWRSRGGAYFEPSENYFSTYGQDPPVMDPYSEQLGHSAPMQAFPWSHTMVDKGLYSQAICLQEVDLGHSMWHMYSAQHLRALKITTSTVSDAYNVLLRYTFQSDGKLKVGCSAHGKPAIGQHGVPGVGGQHASDGKGGFAENHLHWFVIALEPQLKLDSPDVLNKLLVSDLVPPSEEPADWFGNSFHRRTTTITKSTDRANMRYDQSRQRRWRIAAINGTSGEDLGGLRISSHQFGYFLQPGNNNQDLRPEDTYHGSHWWLHQDLYVVNSTGRRDSTVLLARSTEPGYDPHRATAHALRNSPDYDIPVVFCMVKLVHEVIAEELPVQSGFTHLEVTIQPHDLLQFNPQILVRYQPSWNDFMENTWMQSYEAPYTSEYAEPA